MKAIGQRWIALARRVWATVITARRNTKRLVKRTQTVASQSPPIVETVFAHLGEIFVSNAWAHELGQDCAFSATMAAYNIGIFINRLLNRPDGATALIV